MFTRQYVLCHAAALVASIFSSLAIGDDGKLEPARDGVSFFAGGSYDAAISAFTAEIRRDPDDANAFFWRGKAYGARANVAKAAGPSEGQSADRDYESAIGDYTEAIRLDPKFAEAYNNRGAVHFKKATGKQ